MQSINHYWKSVPAWMRIGFSLIAFGWILLKGMEGYWYFYGSLSIEQQRHFPPLPACYHPLDVMVDGYVDVNVISWEDIDGDGKEGTYEHPLQGAYYVLTYTSPNLNERADFEEFAKQTDNFGKGYEMEFRAGCPCNCWKGWAIYVKAPPGYKATTPTSYILSDNEQTFSFGFMKTETTP